MNRFNINYTNDLLNGKLSLEGYNHILSVVGYYTKINQWPVSVIMPEKNRDSRWEKEDYEELVQQYFEWLLVKGKLNYVHKVPDSYRSYYFLQLLMSFISDKIAEYQKTTGVSYSAIRKITLEILEERFRKEERAEKKFWSGGDIVTEDTLAAPDLEECIRSLPKVAITANIKHLKPHVKNCLLSIFEMYQFPIEEETLIKSVYKLFDQSQFHTAQFQSYNSNLDIETESNNNYKSQVDSLVLNLSAIDCQIFLSYLFVNEPPSLDALASKFNLPKSTLHSKIASFKKKIASIYIPVNQDDGVLFLKNVHDVLDKIANQ
ncbi:MAG: hypothetical protein JST10_02265 [Bacteroidetes bacterium]|nr:hypothetical protein [Bacteroidota bacterium]